MRAKIILDVAYQLKTGMISSGPGKVSNHPAPKAFLAFIAFHPPVDEVMRLKECLDALPDFIQYGVFVNDYRGAEPIDIISTDATIYLTDCSNLGYGKAANKLFNSLVTLPEYFCVLNTDVRWDEGSITSALDWLDKLPGISAAVPIILSDDGEMQLLCKRNPTVLALFSRRFVHDSIKPRWLRRYDSWYVMRDMDYSKVFCSEYLSGCCMFIRYQAYKNVGGFDEGFFLYLEDADITRRLASQGMTCHMPVAHIYHSWGKGSYVNLRLLAISIMSSIRYFCKWGLRFW